MIYQRNKSSSFCKIMQMLRHFHKTNSWIMFQLTRNNLIKMEIQLFWVKVSCLRKYKFSCSRFYKKEFSISSRWSNSKCFYNNKNKCNKKIRLVHLNQGHTVPLGNQINFFRLLMKWLWIIEFNLIKIFAIFWPNLFQKQKRSINICNKILSRVKNAKDNKVYSPRPKGSRFSSQVLLLCPSN